MDDKSVINHNQEQFGEQLKEITTKLSVLQTEVLKQNELQNELVSQMRILNAKFDTFFQLLPCNVNL